MHLSGYQDKINALHTGESNEENLKTGMKRLCDKERKMY